MNQALVYLSAILFFIAVFPVHIINYVYISTAQKYASANITAYRIITFLNFNTDKKLKINKNDKNSKDNKGVASATNWLTIFNKLCITKIVQLGDYGMQNPDNAYAALANNGLTNLVYAFVKINGGKTKLKNFTVLNYEHADINYYLKLVGVINIMTLIKLFAIFYWEKLNEYKIEKNAK